MDSDLPEELRLFGKEELGDLRVNSVRDAWLFMIDASPNMRVCSNDQNSIRTCGLKDAMSCAYMAMKQKALMSPQDTLGIVLYNTMEGDVENFPYFSLYIPMEIPSREVCVRLKELIGQDYDIFMDRLAPIIGNTLPDKMLPYSEVFWASSQLFSSVSAAVTRNLIICTNDHDPKQHNPMQINAMKTRAIDFIKSGANIVLLKQNYSNVEFEQQLFWNRLLANDLNCIRNDAFLITSMESMMSNILDMNYRLYRSRPMSAELKMYLDANFLIGVQVFSSFVETKINFSGYVEATTNDAVLPQTQFERQAESDGDTDANAPLVDGIRKIQYAYGGTNISFTPEELKKLKYPEKHPHIRLICTKSKTMLKTKELISHSYFLAPSESIYLGSTDILATFASALLVENNVAICSFSLRQNSSIRLGVLLPRRNDELDNEGVSLYLAPVPFYNDIRVMIPPDTVRRKTAKVSKTLDAFKEIVFPLINRRGGYDPLSVPNPVNSLKNALILAKAVDEEMPVKDRTELDCTNIKDDVFEKLCSKWWKQDAKLEKKKTKKSMSDTMRDSEEKILAKFDLTPAKCKAALKKCCPTL